MSLSKQMPMPEVVNMSSLPADGVLADREVFPDAGHAAHRRAEGADASFWGARLCLSGRHSRGEQSARCPEGAAVTRSAPLPTCTPGSCASLSGPPSRGLAGAPFSTATQVSPPRPLPIASPPPPPTHERQGPLAGAPLSGERVPRLHHMSSGPPRRQATRRH